MIWSQENCQPGTTVHLVGKSKINHVMSVDDERNEITVAKYIDGKFQIEGDEIATEVIKADAIYPLFGGGYRPMMFLVFDNNVSE